MPNEVDGVLPLAVLIYSTGIERAASVYWCWRALSGSLSLKEVGGLPSRVGLHAALGMNDIPCFHIFTLIASMNLASKVTIPSQVMARGVGEETVILDLASGRYFGLDPVGARIWQYMTEGKTMVEICDAMLAEYEVSRKALEMDIARLIDELGAQGLIRAV